MQLEVEVVEDFEQAETFNVKGAALSMSAAMAIGVAWYESQIEVNKLDFDFDRTWDDQIRRLTSSDGYRFDDNARYLNVGHAFVGSYYHMLARANGGNMLQAMLFNLTTSSVWELAVEHREVISLNDTITTSIGGVALGEGLYRLGDFFARSRPTVTNRVLMGVFSPARAIAGLHGDTLRPSAAGFDRHGLAMDAYHRFALSYGGTTALKTTSTDVAGWQGSAALDLELIDLPTYGRAGQGARSLDGGEMTRLAVEYTGSPNQMQAMSLNARSSLWGKYRQDTRVVAADKLDGYSAFLGSSTAFDLSYRDLGSFTDFLMAAHLVGPSADVTLHRSDWRLRLAGDLFPDFAMVRPVARDSSEYVLGESIGHSTLAHGYYYALGLTAAARAEASYRQARAGAALEWSGYDAIEGLDRHQKPYTNSNGRSYPAVMDDPSMADRRLKLRLYSESPLPFTELKLGASLDYLHRAGTASESTRAHEDLRFSLLATYAL